MAVGGAGAREARTLFTLERALPSTSLLSVRLETGRTHQIRVHMQAIGHPVAGDPEYGHAGLLGLERQFLHAARLAFDHPITGEQLELRSPLPRTCSRRRSSARSGYPERFVQELRPVRARIAALPGASDRSASGSADPRTAQQKSKRE